MYVTFTQYYRFLTVTVSCVSAALVVFPTLMSVGFGFIFMRKTVVFSFAFCLISFSIMYG